MAKKKKGKRDEPKAKTRKAKKDLSKGKRQGTKSPGGSRPAKKKPVERQPAKRKPANPKKPAPAKKGVRGKAVPPKKTGPAQTGVRKPAKVPARRRSKAGKNKKVTPGVEKGKRPGRPFKIGTTRKRIQRKNAPADWNFIRDASYKLPTRTKTSRKTLMGSKDKSRGSEFYGKRFRIKKSQKFFSARVVNDDLLSDLVKQNRRILKLSGKKSKKAFFKAYYVDKEGILRIASVTRDDVKTKSDLEGKLRLLLELVKAYGQDLQVTGFETEEVTETWDADENEELGEP